MINNRNNRPSMKMVVAIYNHQEYYPPTLNALEELSKSCDKIYLLGRNIKTSNWIYPKNVDVKLSGSYKDVNEIREASLTWKILSFARFTFNLFLLIIKHKPKWVVCYDSIPLWSFRIATKFIFLKIPKLWYHNHDIIDGHHKFSVSWWAMKSEKNFFNKIDIFSLPSNERQQYFPMNRFKGKYFYIPNFPAKNFYKKFSKIAGLRTDIRILYQGNLSPMHGLEEIMSFIKISELNLRLVLIGTIKKEYKIEIQRLSEELDINNRVELLSPVAYSQLPAITSSCHIGLAIHKLTPINLNYITAGTASNKIYEYAALGLPVLYYDVEHYKFHLSKYKWAVPCDLTNDGIGKSIRHVLDNYDQLSALAIRDFQSGLNFEKVFEPAISYINNSNA